MATADVAALFLLSSFSNFMFESSADSDESREECLQRCPKVQTQECHCDPSTFLEVKDHCFQVFAVFKCASFAYKLFWIMKRYKMTYGTYNIPEVFIIGFTLLKIIILLPNYFFREINTLAVVFILNSMTSYALSYVFAQRTCVVLGLPVKKFECNRIGFIAVCTTYTVIMFVLPLFDIFEQKGSTYKTYNLLMYCDEGKVYPLRFLYIWLSDIVFALGFIVDTCYG